MPTEPEFMLHFSSVYMPKKPSMQLIWTPWEKRGPAHPNPVLWVVSRKKKNGVMFPMYPTSNGVVVTRCCVWISDSSRNNSTACQTTIVISDIFVFLEIIWLNKINIYAAATVHLTLRSLIIKINSASCKDFSGDDFDLKAHKQITVFFLVFLILPSIFIHWVEEKSIIH